LNEGRIPSGKNYGYNLSETSSIEDICGPFC